MRHFPFFTRMIRKSKVLFDMILAGGAARVRPWPALNLCNTLGLPWPCVRTLTVLLRACADTIIRSGRSHVLWFVASYCAYLPSLPCHPWPAPSLLTCMAQPLQAPATQAQIAALQQAVQNAQSAGDNAWMLVSAALVLLMTGPGLALFYGGLVRRKNILGTMMQSFAMMGLITVLWAIVGYSLAFGHGNAFIGGFEHLFLRGVSLSPNPDYAPTIPEQTFMIYQLMFAIITPALITGAFAERMKFSSMAVFLSLWSLLVYCPMAHMVWGVGGLLNADRRPLPVLDFAGGTVVHITSGVSALVTALYLGKRIGYPQHGHAAALDGAELHRRLPAVGGLVRVQCRQRACRRPAGHQRLHQHPVCRGRRGPRLDSGRVASQRQAHGAGRHLRRGGRAGYHHPGLRLRAAHVGARHRPRRRRWFAPSWSSGQEVLRLRRFARRLWRARRWAARWARC